MVKLTPIKVFRGDDIDRLNEQIWQAITLSGNRLNFGDEAEKKAATEVFSVIQLYGKAIPRLYSGEVPDGWLFKGKAVKEYAAMLKDPDKGDQPYTYGERLHKNSGLERARDTLKTSIETGVQSNRIVGALWESGDLSLKSPPCFNWFQLRLMEPGSNDASLRILFRSHDYGNGVFANLRGITELFIDEVIGPAGGKLSEIILTSTSAHLYDNDMDMVFAHMPGLSRIPKSVGRMF